MLNKRSILVAIIIIALIAIPFNYWQQATMATAFALICLFFIKKYDSFFAVFIAAILVASFVCYETLKIALTEIYMTFVQVVAEGNRMLLPVVVEKEQATFISITYLLMLVAIIVISSMQWIKQTQTYMFIGFLIVVIEATFNVWAPLFLHVLFLLLVFIPTWKAVRHHLVYVTVCVISCVLLIVFPQMEQKLLVLQQVVIEEATKNATISDFPEGNLRYATQWLPTDEVVATIKMQHPYPLYIKKYVGESFTKSRWNSLAKTDEMEHYHTIKALEKSKFNENALLTRNETELQKAIIQSNEPLTLYEQQTFHKKENGVYELTVATNDVSHFPKWVTVSYGAQVMSEETHYRSYVNEVYTALQEDLRQQLVAYFSIEEGLTYEQAIKFVTKTVEETISYSEQIDGTNTNFVETLLQQKNEGYAVHQATLATLLFRAIHVPARYVEGYVYTGNDENERNEIVITKKDAHAWTEIYIDRVGWIPVDVVAKVAEQMPTPNYTYLPKQSKGEAPTATPKTGDGQVKPKTVADDTVDEQPPLETTKDSPSQTFIWIMFISALLLIILLIVFLWLKRHRNKRIALKKQLNKMERVLQKYGVHYIGGSKRQFIKTIERNVSLVAAEIYEQAQAIYEHAIYSGQPITTAQLQRCKQLNKKLRIALKKVKG